MMSRGGGRWGWDVEQEGSPRSWGQEKQEGSRGGHQGFLPATVTISTLQLGWAACGKPRGCSTALCSKAQVAGRPGKVSGNVSRWPEIRAPQNQAWNFCFPCIS